MPKVRLTLCCFTILCLLAVIGQQFYYATHPHRSDFDAHYICSIDGHAYIAYAEDGFNDDKTISRVKDADHVCTDK
jgi:hypothetical protein